MVSDGNDLEIAKPKRTPVHSFVIRGGPFHAEQQAGWRVTSIRQATRPPMIMVASCELSHTFNDQHALYPNQPVTRLSPPICTKRQFLYLTIELDDFVVGWQIREILPDMRQDFLDESLIGLLLDNLGSFPGDVQCNDRNHQDSGEQDEHPVS